MPDTVHLPGLGEVKKSYALVGGAAIVGGFYVVYRRQQQANAVAASGANTGIDPATGYPYGSPEDAAALGNQGAYVNPGTGAGGIGGTTGYVPPGQTGSTVPQAFRNNAEWTQYVIDYMEGHDIVTSDAPLGSALGKYITGVVPTADEVNLINQAVAIAGYPPISGPDGYPPSIRTGTTTPPPTGGGSPPPTGGGTSGPILSQKPVSGWHTTGPIKPNTTLSGLAGLYWGHPEWGYVIYQANPQLPANTLTGANIPVGMDLNIPGLVGFGG